MPHVDPRLLNQLLSVRLNAAEMSSVNRASEQAGVSRSEWLRGLISEAIGRTPKMDRPDTVVLLEEIGVLRSLLLNLFPATFPALPVSNILRVLNNAEETKELFARSRIEADGR